MKTSLWITGQLEKSNDITILIVLWNFGGSFSYLYKESKDRGCCMLYRL